MKKINKLTIKQSVADNVDRQERKTSDHNKERAFVTKLQRHELDKVFTLEKMPNRTLAQLSDFGDELLEYAVQDPNMIYLDQFLIRKGVSYKTYQTWRKRSEKLAEDHEKAMRVLGYKQLYKVANGELSKDAVLFLLHNYLPEWKDSDQYHTDLKKQVQDSNKQDFQAAVENWVTITSQVLKPLPISDMVPPKTTPSRDPEEVAKEVRRLNFSNKNIKRANTGE